MTTSSSPESVDLSPRLSPDERDSAQRDGFFVVRDILSRGSLDRLLDRLEEYASGRRPLPPGASAQREPRVERGEVMAPAGADIRKIDGLARGDALFGELTRAEAIAGRMQALVDPELELYRAAVLMKPAGVGSAKGMHQDAPYWPFEPMTQWSCWIALDDATPQNGCMSAIPGSHLQGPLPHVEAQDDFVVPETEFDRQRLVELPMPAGAGLFFHALLLHGTTANTSPHPRRAITISYLSARARFTGPGPRPVFVRVG